MVSTAFQNSFPGIKIEVLGDLSKYLDGRINRIYQTSNGTDDGADVVVIQSLHNFPQWKRQHRLLNYKPANWDDIYPEFVDEDGAYAGYYICTSPLPSSLPHKYIAKNHQSHSDPPFSTPWFISLPTYHNITLITSPSDGPTKSSSLTQTTMTPSYTSSHS